LSKAGVLVIAVIAASSLGALGLWACGPFFPQWLLTGDSRILEAPVTWLRDAVQPLLSADKPPFPVVVDEKGPVHQTAEADRRDLETALAALPASRRQAVIEPYVKVREAIVAWREQVAAWREEARWNDQAPPRPAPPKLAVPPGLPGEFEDYLQGAIAYHQEKPDAARAAWEKLLARPEGERRLRSTWTAFMLGKLAAEKDPATAVRWFERTRELAAKDFADPLGLAQASFGWQARAEIARRQPEAALKLYLLQEKAGEPTAVDSIRRVCGKAAGDPAALQRLARSAEARPVFTAWVLSVWTREDYDGPLDPEPARKWLAALRAAGVTKADGADRLAWAAYRAGDFNAAEDWLKRAPADAPMARWIRAKLLLRAGKVAEAEALLAQAAAALPASAVPGHDTWSAYDNGVQPALRPRAEGELGAARLTRGEYPAALDSLVRGGYWTDAAYVAERVLTIDELRAYVDKTWPAALAAHYDPKAESPADDKGEAWGPTDAGLVPVPDARAAYDADAQSYLPKPWQAPADALRQALAAGRDEKRPAPDRARSLFRAACLTRHQGLELLGTELEPDWHIWEGSYEVDPFAAARADAKTHQQLGPSKDETARVARSRVEPAKRFHYRYLGADLARSAAELLPDGSPEKAGMMATAGTWLKNRDPKAAQPFYDALLSCCADTDLARKAKRLKSIPTTDVCEGDTKPKSEEGN
jgi:hypothetical protein